MLDQRLNLGCNHDIGSLETGHSISLSDHRDSFFSTLNVAITDHHPRTVASKRQRGRAPDS
jgi:hypothetical protein